MLLDVARNQQGEVQKRGRLRVFQAPVNIMFQASGTRQFQFAMPEMQLVQALQPQVLVAQRLPWRNTVPKSVPNQVNCPMVEVTRRLDTSIARCDVSKETGLAQLYSAWRTPLVSALHDSNVRLFGSASIVSIEWLLQSSVRYMSVKLSTAAMPVTTVRTFPDTPSHWWTPFLKLWGHCNPFSGLLVVLCYFPPFVCGVVGPVPAVLELRYVPVCDVQGYLS